MHADTHFIYQSDQLPFDFPMEIALKWYSLMLSWLLTYILVLPDKKQTHIANQIPKP